MWVQSSLNSNLKLDTGSSSFENLLLLHKSIIWVPRISSICQCFMITIFFKATNIWTVFQKGSIYHWNNFEICKCWTAAATQAPLDGEVLWFCLATRSPLRSKMSRFNLLRFCCSLLTSGKALELFVFKCNTKACNNACHFCRDPEFLCASGAGFPQSSPIWIPQAAWWIFTIFSLDSYFVHITIGHNIKSSREDNHRWTQIQIVHTTKTIFMILSFECLVREGMHIAEPKKDTNDCLIRCYTHC